MPRLIDRHDNEREVPEVNPGSEFTAELRSIIDEAASGNPTMSAFIERLESRGVTTVPSIQSSGRLNGMTYRYRGQTLKGSDLGREYTANGLQRRAGVHYEPDRDDPRLRECRDRNTPPRLARDFDPHDDARNSRRDRIRERESGLSSDQRMLLREIGTFRTVLVGDIERHYYGSRHGQLRQDVAVLARAGLADRRTHAPKPGKAYTVLVLTKQGRNLLEREERNRGGKQKFYANFVKPSEIRHDVGIYRMYQLEKARIEREGGTVKRVTLDFELKRRVFEKLNKHQAESRRHYDERKRKIAEENGIAVVNGRLVFPDVRIEYETLDREPAKVDLELASGDYKESQIATKYRAGFRIYGPDSGLGSPALSDPQIVVGYISL